MSMEKIIPTDIELVNIFGVNDNNLKYIKSMFPLLKINVRGNIIYIDGNDKEANEVIRILDEMLKMNILIRGKYGDFNQWSRISMGKLEDIQSYIDAIPVALEQLRA